MAILIIHMARVHSMMVGCNQHISTGITTLNSTLAKINKDHMHHNHLSIGCSTKSCDSHMITYTSCFL